MEACLTGDIMISAVEAERTGLVSRVVNVEALLTETCLLAKRIASHSLPVVKEIKQMVNLAYEPSLSRGIEAERGIFYSTFRLVWLLTFFPCFLLIR